jgi:hypothetical protein
MKITIDTTNKTIEILENINLIELLEKLKNELGINPEEYNLKVKEYVPLPSYDPTQSPSHPPYDYRDFQIHC